MSDVGSVDVPNKKCECPHCLGHPDIKPYTLVISCPQCHRQHIDHVDAAGIDWSKKLHRKHQCVNGPCTCDAVELIDGNVAHTTDCLLVVPGCGFEWQPALVYTVGVETIL